MFPFDVLSPTLPPPPIFSDGRIEPRHHPGRDKLTAEIREVVDSVDCLEQKRERDEKYREWQTQCVMAQQRSLIMTQRILMVLLAFWVVTNGPIAITMVAKWAGIDHKQTSQIQEPRD